ncbi:MAG TPA: phosphotransferase [Nitrososphaerales archaeon]|nr:phosphotransferase [Nitrososphaerales archaeon]
MIDQIAATVAENESLGDYDSHVLTAPTTGYDTVASKWVVNLVSRDRSEKIFVKISNSEGLSVLLQNETESIGAYYSLGMTGIPKVLACGFIEGRYFLAQRFVPGSTMHGRPSYLDVAVAKTKDWLAALYEKTRGPTVESAELIRRAKDYAWHASDFFDLADCLALMEKLSPKNPMPTFRIHGDFWHRNILLQGEEIFVTDFAFSTPGEPPIDYLDLICDYDPNIFLDPERLRNYTKLMPIDGKDLPFLHVYALIRKIGIKAQRRKMLYDELLLSNLEGSMNEIKEVGVAKQAVRYFESRQS